MLSNTNTNENDSVIEDVRRILLGELDRTCSGATTSLYIKTQNLLQAVTEGLQMRLSSTTAPSTSDQASPSFATPGNSSLTQVQISSFWVHQKKNRKDQKANPAMSIVLNPTRNLAYLIKLKHFMLICIQNILN